MKCAKELLDFLPNVCVGESLGYIRGCSSCCILGLSSTGFILDLKGTMFLQKNGDTF